MQLQSEFTYVTKLNFPWWFQGCSLKCCEKNKGSVSFRGY